MTWGGRPEAWADFSLRSTGLRLRLLLPILGATTVVLVLAGLVQWSEEQARLRASRAAEVAALMDRLGHLLPPAVEDLDIPLVTSLLKVELDGLHVGALECRLAGKTLVQARKPGFHGRPDDAVVVRSLPLAVTRGESVQVALTLDPAPLIAATAAARWATAVMVLTVDLVVAVAVLVVVNQVTRPITALTSAARTIADGHLDVPMATTGAVEVVELAQSFERMRLAIRTTIATIGQQNRDLDARVQERSRQLEATQAELLEAANLAGKAELATGILHNIGNVLTGVFIDLEQLRGTSTGDLLRTAEALVARLEALADPEALRQHLAQDPGGVALHRLAALVLKELLAEGAARTGVITHLERHLTMIRDIVAIQQANARGRLFIQSIDLRMVVEDMLLLHANGLRQRGIRVTTVFGELPLVLGDRVKLSHVVANVLKNAQEALEGTDGNARGITIATAVVTDPPEHPPGRYGVLTVHDTGHGIEAEVQARLFTHGFTTKRDGHGFGLHACANAMQEMSGSIRLQSDGPGTGTTVRILLPLASTKVDPTVAT